MNGRKGAKAPRRKATRRDQEFVRELNDRVAAERPSGMFVEFACECERHRCRASIPLTLEEYDAVRRHPRRFAVLPDHADNAGDVVEPHSRYAVVEPAGASPVRSPSRELATPVSALSAL